MHPWFTEALAAHHVHDLHDQAKQEALVRIARASRSPAHPRRSIGLGLLQAADRLRRRLRPASPLVNCPDQVPGC